MWCLCFHLLKTSLFLGYFLIFDDLGDIVAFGHVMAFSSSLLTHFKDLST